MVEFNLSESTIIFCLIVLFFISILGALVIKPKKFQESKAFVFVSILTSVSIVIIGLNVVVNTISLEFQQTVAKMELTKQAGYKMWIYPNQIFCEKDKARPEFLASFYYNNLNLYTLTKNVETKITLASELEEQFISILIFQCWEDHLTFRNLDEAGDEVWLCNYLQWAQSPYLKANFDRLRYNLAGLTIRFGELLFEYASKLPVPTVDPNSYKDLIDAMLKDPRLIAVYKEREQL
jgi:hypothetical protein